MKSFFTLSALFLLTVAFSSCDNDNRTFWPEGSLQAIVTVKPAANGAYYMQLDDTTTLIPANDYKPYFGTTEEQRAFVVYMPAGQSPRSVEYAVDVLAMDSILTKPIAENLGAIRNDEIYGDDPVELWDVWIEDGYLSFRFSTYFSGNRKHFVNLIRSDETGSPYEVEFRHNAYDDNPGYTGGSGLWKGWGWVSFKLDKLPDTQGQTVKLKIKYDSYSGKKVFEMNYCTLRPAGEKADVTATDTLQALQ